MRAAPPSPHRRNDEGVAAVSTPVRPALGDLLHPGPELQPLGPILVGVTESRTLPPAEAVIGDGHRDRHVDADHAHVDARCEFARGMAITGEDRDAIAILVFARQPQRLLEILRAYDLEHGAEDFLP